MMMTPNDKANRQASRQASRQVNSQANRQASRQVNSQANRQVNRPIKAKRKIKKKKVAFPATPALASACLPPQFKRRQAVKPAARDARPSGRI